MVKFYEEKSDPQPRVNQKVTPAQRMVKFYEDKNKEITVDDIEQNWQKEMMPYLGQTKIIDKSQLTRQLAESKMANQGNSTVETIEEALDVLNREPKVRGLNADPSRTSHRPAISSMLAAKK